MKLWIFPVLVALALVTGCKGADEKPAPPKQSEQQKHPATDAKPAEAPKADAAKPDAATPAPAAAPNAAPAESQSK
jgi:hypothetical protein